MISWYKRNVSTLIDLNCDQAATKWCKLSLSASPSENPISPQTKKGEISPSKRTKSFVGNFFPRTNLPSHQPSFSPHFPTIPQLYFCFSLDNLWQITKSLQYLQFKSNFLHVKCHYFKIKLREKLALGSPRPQRNKEHCAWFAWWTRHRGGSVVCHAGSLCALPTGMRLTSALWTHV